MFEQFGIKDDAFRNMPKPGVAFWYGFTDLKSQFENILKRTFNSTQSLSVLNRGRIGCGKTHAANYYSNINILEEIDGTYDMTYSVVAETPKQSSNYAFYYLYSKILDSITFTKIMECGISLREKICVKKLKQELMKVTKNEEIAGAISSISDESKLAYQAYLFGVGTVRELRSIGVVQKLTTNSHYVAALSAVIYLLVNGSGAKTKSTRFILWIDEMEDLVYYPTRFYLPFTQALRELIDKNTDHCNFFFNFTFAEPEELNSIEEIMGRALMSRVDQHIIFADSTETDVKSYLIELLKANRISKRLRQSETSPFDRTAFDMLVKTCINRTPRQINKLCYQLLEKISDIDSSVKTIDEEHLSDLLPDLIQELDESKR